MAIGSGSQHKIDYIEFQVSNMQKTKDFYGKLFSWEFTDYSPEYVGIKNGDGEMGGFCLVDKVVSGGPLIVLFSESIDESFNSVVSSGAEITKEIFSFPGGQRFQFKDPSGNELAVWAKL